MEPIVRDLLVYQGHDDVFQWSWRDADNNDVPMDAQGVIALGAAAIQHVQQQYAISWALKAQIDDATREQLEEIKWPS